MEKVLFTVYNIILLFLFPFFFIALTFLNLAKNKRSEGYLYKFFPSAFKPLKKENFNEGVWIHAVSLGEMRAAVNFIDLLQSEYGKKIYLSATTKTGFDFADNLYKNNGNVLTFYFPYDFLFSVSSILKLIKPSLFISVETEIWPNLFNILNKKNIPIALINARISEKSYKNYIRFRFFFGYIFKKIDSVLCISDMYCKRFASLGIKEENMHQTGNMKFDMDASLIAGDINEKTAILKKFIEYKNNNSEYAKIIAAGSTHKREEELIADSVIKLNKLNHKNKIFLFVAPRHPERFDEVYKLLNNYLPEIELYKLSSIYSSHYDSKDIKNIKDNNSCGLSENKVVVILVDIIGQLLTVYGICDAAFVGGSLIPSGGHNLLEPLLFGKPVIFGRYVQNFSEAAEEIIKNSAGRQIDSPLELYNALADYLFNDKSADSAGKNGLNLIARNKGVSLRNLEYLNYKGYLLSLKSEDRKSKKIVDKIIKTN